MMRRPATLLIVCALLLTSTAALGRAPVVPPTASDLRAIVETLTTREMDGRRAGTPGGDRATERLAAWLGAAGLRPGGDSGTFLQSFTLAPGRRLGAGRALEGGGHTVKAAVDLAPPDLPAGNVIAVLPGADPVLAGETIVLGAHWDHLGSSGGAIYHGADDNASGTAVVVGLARAFAAAGGARRTLVFVLFGAEEVGLIGSGHYVRHAALPLGQTAAMLNFDMVGRMRDGTLTIGGVDSGDRLRAATADAARAARLCEADAAGAAARRHGQRRVSRRRWRRPRRRRGPAGPRDARQRGRARGPARRRRARARGRRVGRRLRGAAHRDPRAAARRHGAAGVPARRSGPRDFRDAREEPGMSLDPKGATTLIDVMRRRAALTPQAQYFSLFDDTVTYARLWAQSGRYAAGLAAAGG